LISRFQADQLGRGGEIGKDKSLPLLRLLFYLDSYKYFITEAVLLWENLTIRSGSYILL